MLAAGAAIDRIRATEIRATRMRCMALVYARTVPLLLGLVGRRDGQGFQELLAPRRHLLGLNLDRIANLKSVGLNLLLAPQDLRFAGEVEIQQIPFGGL